MMFAIRQSRHWLAPSEIADIWGEKLISCVFLFRISYCTADKTQDKVFAYVSQSQFNETLECHAFLCQKKKIVRVEH